MTDERDEPSFDMAEAKKPSRRKTAPREEAATPVPEPAPSGPVAYRVLARKYRPQTFEALIGQEALVRTLANAFATGRIAHAFMLTGVRGVGKTTTARIIARALNCTGEDGKRTAPTITPCGVCEACVSIAESRNVDVQEMDAASRTGIDDIREIIEGVRYSPASARYKVYIIDEVHMLSRQAFNGLLKTLEEPPPHVKFIFATTEVRKLPVTVLSRCQRYDLRRIEPEYTDIVALCANPQSVAEVAAAVKLPLAVTKILVGDLIGDLRERRARAEHHHVGLARPDRGTQLPVHLDADPAVETSHLSHVLADLRRIEIDGPDDPEALPGRAHANYTNADGTEPHMQDTNGHDREDS